MKIRIDYNGHPDFDDSRVTLQDPETYDELDFQKFIGKKIINIEYDEWDELLFTIED